jgi:hypothetical protein
MSSAARQLAVPLCSSFSAIQAPKCAAPLSGHGSPLWTPPSRLLTPPNESPEGGNPFNSLRFALKGERGWRCATAPGLPWPSARHSRVHFANDSGSLGCANIVFASLRDSLRSLAQVPQWFC